LSTKGTGQAPVERTGGKVAWVRSSPISAGSAQVQRFHLAPPRRFVLPAVLLLLSERPSYGYDLTRRLQELSFGHADRPAVYRALAQLEADGLVNSHSQDPLAGSARRVYQVTPLGEEVLRVWMGVIKQEHASLTRVLLRYQATGRADALLAEVEGGWGAELGPTWPVVVPVAARRHLLHLLSEDYAGEAGGDGPDAQQEDAQEEAVTSPQGIAAPAPQSFSLVPERSVVLIEARSTVGPISFGAIGIGGWARASLCSGAIATVPPPEAHLEFEVRRLTSGNPVYDAELLRRVEADRFPTTAVDLVNCTSISQTGYRASGVVCFHGTSRQVEGTVRVEASPTGRLVVEGEQALDMRDFSIPVPTVLMLRIYPDVKVLLHVEAEPEGAGATRGGSGPESCEPGSESCEPGSKGAHAARRSEVE